MPESTAPTLASTTKLHAIALSRRPAEPVGEFLLIPFGDVQVERPLAGGDFVFTREHAAAAVAWFESIGRKLAIDYEHQSFALHNTRPDGLRPAAGWIGGLQVRDDGLWAADVTWTERARELLAGGEYRYFSPVIFWADEDYTSLAALGPVALTNDPAMHGVQPLAANGGIGGGMGRSGLDDLPVTLSHASTGRVQSDPAHATPAAETEVMLLRRQLAERDADAFVERGVRLGKIVDATRDDWRDEFLRDAELAESKLSRSPVVCPPGRVIPLDATGRPRAIPLTHAGNHELYRRWGVQPEDLAAFDKAVAAGRVK